MVRAQVTSTPLCRVRRMLATLFVAASCTIVTTDVCARMYQWTNPDTGRVQLSGSPPAWYRGTNPGPRVLVFDNGELVDDTALQVTESRRLELRSGAFGSDGDALDGPAADAGDLRAALARAAERGVDVDAVASEFAEEQRLAAAAEAEPELTEDAAAKAESLKALIEAWDLRQLEEARALLELLPPEADEAAAND